MRHVLPGLLLLAAVVGSANPAAAKFCGDAVGGRDVACDCGDVVVSNVVLSADDPVTQAPCPGDGLVVRAPQATQALVVDLHGQTLRGLGHGAGVLLLDGGPGGASVVSPSGPATVDGFQDGVAAHGDRAVAVISDLLITGSRRDGVRIEAFNYEIRDTVVRGAGRDGFGLDGKGYTVARTRAEGSGRNGYTVAGTDGTLGGDGGTIVATGSGYAGLNVMGMGHTVTACVADDGPKDGIRLWGMHLVVRGCDASRNGENGIYGMGMDWHLQGNQANDNGNDGLDVYGYWMVDDGGNHGAGNRGEDERTPATQCEIDGQPCKP